MEENFNKLVKQIRFYVCIISGIIMIAFMSYGNKYKIEYNRVEKEYKQCQQDGTDYNYTNYYGDKCTATVFPEIYKGQIENIVEAQMGKDFVYETRSGAGGNAAILLIPFTISLIMCMWTLLKGMMPKIDYNQTSTTVLTTIGAVAFIFVLMFAANTIVRAINEPSASEQYYIENQEAIDTYNENHKDDWKGYKGTRRNSWAEDQKLRHDGYDPQEYRKQHGYKYYD